MSKPGASWVSVPSMVASARNTAAISGGTASPWSETMRNRSVNIRHVGGDPGCDVPGQEPAQHPLQAQLVQLLGSLDHLQQRVGQPGGVAPVQGQQQPLQRGAQPGVDAPDRPEVEQAERPVGQQQHVARVRVGVEGPVQHDLAEQAVQQAAGQRGAHVSGHADVDRGQRPPVQALHHQHQPGAQRLVRAPEWRCRGCARPPRRPRRSCCALRSAGRVPRAARRRTRRHSSTAPTARPQLVLRSSRAASRTDDVQVPVHDRADVRPAHLDHHPVPRGQRRRVDLGDRRRGDRLPVEGWRTPRPPPRPARTAAPARSAARAPGRRRPAGGSAR